MGTVQPAPLLEAALGKVPVSIHRWIAAGLTRHARAAWVTVSATPGGASAPLSVRLPRSVVLSICDLRERVACGTQGPGCRGRGSDAVESLHYQGQREPGRLGSPRCRVCRCQGIGRRSLVL